MDMILRSGRRLAPLAAVLLWASPSYAQDKTFTLTVINQDLQVLSAALDELPRKVSEPVVEKLQRELMPQMAPAEPAKTEDRSPSKADEKK